jgi:hypothetical protein
LDPRLARASFRSSRRGRPASVSRRQGTVSSSPVDKAADISHFLPALKDEASTL